jgi:translation initiation factor IF-2
MTDPETSGAPANPAPAETPGAPKAAENAPQFGAFGSTRGSGLARGKRPVTAASPASTPSTEYKPTAIEVVVPQREYRNPFGEPAAAAEPAVSAPVQAAPAVPEAPVAQTEVPHAPPPAEAAEAPASPPAASVHEEISEKAELNILPPAEDKRPPVHWGTTPAPRPDAADPGVFQTRARREEQRNDRSSFRSEPRREQGPEGREPRRDETRREPERHEHRNESRREGGEHRGSYRAPSETPHREKGGFFAWLKSLFSPKAPEVPAETAPRHEGDGQFHRRRHRGGRNRHRGDGQQGYSGPPREGDPSDFRGGAPEPREGRPNYRGGDREGGGGRRRRHRGGRGRDRGDSRPEGWQGGGAI